MASDGSQLAAINDVAQEYYDSDDAFHFYQQVGQQQQQQL